MSVSDSAKSGDTMTRNMVKPANCRSLITCRAVVGRRWANNHQRFIRDLRDKIISGFSDLALMPNQHPLPQKNLLLLLRKNLRGNEVLLRERFRPGLESLSCLAKCRDHREA